MRYSSSAGRLACIDLALSGAKLCIARRNSNVCTCASLHLPGNVWRLLITSKNRAASDHRSELFSQLMEIMRDPCFLPSYHRSSCYPSRWHLYHAGRLLLSTSDETVCNTFRSSTNTSVLIRKKEEKRKKRNEQEPFNFLLRVACDFAAILTVGLIKHAFHGSRRRKMIGAICRTCIGRD